MPRTLPWLVSDQSGATTTPPRPRRSAKITPSRVKPVRQQRTENDESNSAVEGTPRRKVPRGQARTPSTSPPPEAPKEEYMIEGRDADDMWRMVEDEMTSIAHTFTQHLHHQEYVRQKHAARTRNSRTIDTISRPVTGIMPDHTRRKVESVSRARTQGEAVKSILGKQPRMDSDAESDESDESEAPAWIGTSLHGLMEQRQRLPPSLSQAGSMSVPTRAAAGFKRSRKAASLQNSSPPSSPPLRSEAPKSSKNIMLASDPTATESDDDDDDLDAPIQRPSHFPTKPKVHKRQEKPHTNPTSRTAPSVVVQTTKADETVSMEFASERPVKAVSSRLERIRKRLEEAKQQKMKEEEEPNLHEIPTFL